MPERREYTEAERVAAVEGYRRWPGSQGAYARSVGIPQTTLSRWVNGERGPHRRVESQAPTMLEVVPQKIEAVVEGRPSRSGARLSLGGGVELGLDALPPARWVAELAAELRRC